jgi:hypothetical protein
MRYEDCRCISSLTLGYIHVYINGKDVFSSNDYF